MLAGLGRALIGEDDDARGLATRAIIFLLAHVGCGHLLDQALPPSARQVGEDPLDARLYPHADTAWSAYFAAYASAAYGPNPTEDLRFALAAALREARSTIPAARLEYRFHGDVGRLLDEVLPPLSTVLRTAAELIGHEDAWGRREELGLGRDAAELLKASKLADWISVFAADLRQLWERRGAWTSVREFAALGQHIERLLWGYGIFLWETGDGALWVSVPLGSDRPRLAWETLKRPWRWLKRRLLGHLS